MHTLTDVAFTFVPDDGSPSQDVTFEDLVPRFTADPDAAVAEHGYRFEVRGRLTKRKRLVLLDAGGTQVSRPVQIGRPEVVLVVGAAERINSGDAVAISLVGTGTPVQLVLDEPTAKRLLLDALIREHAPN